ncbi:perlwapin-like [Cherax quadricarinatus]|uniref:perlwapin-like n=1 Tax=Cherax quadricarinatus TaxID=27406 RepID=UPI00387E6ACD
MVSPVGPTDDSKFVKRRINHSCRESQKSTGAKNKALVPLNSIFNSSICSVVLNLTNKLSYNPNLSVCPPSGSSGYFCDQQCTTDEQCGTNRYCCQVSCGNTCITRYQPVQSPSCPPPNPLIRCIIFHHSCNNDEECSQNGCRGYCCLEPACGRRCVEAEPKRLHWRRCPDPNSFGRFCLIFRHQCNSNLECQLTGRGRQCCLVAGCGRECIN